MNKFPSKLLPALVVMILAIAWSLPSQSSCRYLPTDTEWPSDVEWNGLNDTVSGHLMATEPLAAVCHGDKFQASRCKGVKDEWISPLFHEKSPSSLLAPYYQNQSCDPFTPQSKPCELGNYVVYSINASSTADVAAGIKFAKEKNVRLVIKNTGHDFLGRSTGTGGLSIWTHNLRTIEFLPAYTSPAYNGTAMKMGAGTRAFEAIDAAHKNGVQVITGFCPTVGIIGGFLQGGGSGPLASFRGLAADQVLEFEVVTAAGDLVVATPEKHSDLYWALSGGGGGTYGVVVSVTLRVFEDGMIGGAVLAFSRENVSTHDLYDILGHLFDVVPSLIDSGVQLGWQITKTSFELGPVTAPGFTVHGLRQALEPFTSRLESAGIKYKLNVTSMPSYKTHFETYLGPSPAGRYNANAMLGSRLIPRGSLTINRTALIDMTRSITENSSTFIVFLAANVTRSTSKQPVADNAVLPQWRDSAIHALATLIWDFDIPQKEMLARHAELLDHVVPQLRAVVPGNAGTYLNEAEVDIQNWKDDFFGANYNRLRHIKKFYDPNDLFYAEYSVGSDSWYRASDGRLCRTQD
ncbi:hypothetical protein BKA66DRAFT_586305 [Pyrenochaeta sp. MPI-SDFR-AT-0127]|nr:hypothetical protein BKA66DRAFT_586305 [Pyrenochaeta sp. MPI-SDFR-AT-0127]